MTSVAAEPEDFARALLKRFGVSGRLDLTNLAGKIGLQIREVDARGFEGALIRAPNKAKGIIAVRRGIREAGRRRFTIAHEFGHYILPGHGVSERTCKGKNIESASRRIPSHEAAANRFASELLLPTAQIQPIVRVKLASIETAEFLSSKFDTSLTASLLKSVELSHERCCVVMSKDQVIEWARPNESFKHFIGRRETLSGASLASKLVTNEGDGRASGLVSAEVWLDDSRLKPDAKIYEDSIFQSHYNSVLTILTINEPLSDQDVVDEDPLLDELDPDEFTIGRRRWPGRR